MARGRGVKGAILPASEATDKRNSVSSDDAKDLPRHSSQFSFLLTPRKGAVLAKRCGAGQKERPESRKTATFSRIADPRSGPYWATVWKEKVPPPD